MFQYEYWQWESVIPVDVCERILARAFDSAQATAAEVVHPDGLPRPAISDIRVTDVVWSDDLELADIAFRFIHEANAAANWHITATTLEKVQIGRYGVGGHYDWHIDCSPPKEGLQRKLSLSLQLSDPDSYEGGDLLLGRKTPTSVTRKQGSIVVFPSCIFHKVTPVTRGERFSAVAWMRGPQFR